MNRKDTASYNIVVKNRPGELAKLTKLLSEAGINVSDLRIANLGEKSCIRFSAPREQGRRPSLRRRAAGFGLK